jgi:two-component system, sensor histidine kinase
MRVVVVTPNVADSELARSFLGEHAIDATTVADVGELGAFDLATLGCIVLVEEALGEPAIEYLQAILQSQPRWSDLPLLIVTSHESLFLSLMPGLFPDSGTVTLLQRPLHPGALVSAAKAALRSRARQFEVRDLLELRERAVRQRDEFLAMLAHELRNPLAPIRNAVYLLSTLQHDDPLFLKCRTMIDKQARHITRLVDDLLDVSRLELGKVELRVERMDLNECVAAATESCGPITNARRHMLELRLSKGLLPVRADPVRLEQAICNLIVNAAKFTPEGGQVEVETRREGAFAVASVTDNGVGIKAEMLESIFDLFTQDSATIARTQGGLGIGLTLVKRLVELHGGSVHAFSEGLGSGSRFEARLPLELAGTEELPVAAPPRESQPKRVLIVEDAVDNRDSLGMLLRTWNHEVTYAGNGPDGVDRAIESRPDIALVDIGLPGFDGYQVASRIRREGSAWARRVRLIALTGYGQANDRARALEAGFDTHVLKPVDPGELRRLIS